MLVLVGIAVLAAAPVCPAAGRLTATEQVEPTSANSSMTITGRISVKGSMPHVYLCLTTEEGVDYRLVGPLQEQIERDFQQQRLHLSGEVVTAALGPGFPAAFWVRSILDVE